MLNLIRELCAIPGISGRESAVRDRLSAKLRASGVPLAARTDALGNLIVEKGEAPGRVALYAHMDEVGFLITHITAEGLLGFAPVGVDPRVIFGRRVRVGEKRLPGAVGGAAWHHLDAKEREAKLEMKHMAIDIGAVSREEAAGAVKPGDMAVFDAPFTELAGGRVASPAIDNRAGCAQLLRLLTETEPSFTAVFTVQEEAGLAGAAVSAAAVNAPIAVVLETTTAGDLPDVDEAKRVCRLGAGPVLSFADRGAIYDAGLFAAALAAAREGGLPVQVKEGLFGGNDGRAVQRAGAGARTLAVSLPCRYLHSASCVADGGDILAMAALLRALLPTL